PAAGEQRIRPLRIPVLDLATAIPDIPPVAALGVGGEHAAEPVLPLVAVEGMPLTELDVEMAPGSPPGSPAPDVDVAGEGVGGIPGRGVPEQLAPRDVHDAVVLRIPGEQLVAEAEEGVVGKAVVLQHDRAVDPVEDPIEARGKPALEADVPAREVAGHLARP